MPNYKLNFEDVRVIRLEYSKKTKTIAQLAIEYGVHSDTIYSITSGRTWRRKWSGLEASGVLY